MTGVASIDPRTGRVVEEVAPETTPEEVARRCATAAAAAPSLEALGRRGRTRLLRAMADELETQRHALVEVADRETALGEVRLEGELTRTTFQLRFFADVLDDGAYLEATIDHAAATAMGPRPDLRRMLRPLGPVGVFGASNFPFAFSVPGGDTASALAAGCPVVVKAHEAHPRTAELCASALRRGAVAAGASEDIVSLVYGVAAGRDVVSDSRIQAIGFTGSLGGGRALHDLASSRPSPIPFYGELGALNAFVVSPGAAGARAGDLATGLAGSFNLGVGQFCTKPGLALFPAGEDGDELLRALTAEVRARSSAVMLSERVADGFARGSNALLAGAGVRRLAEGSPPTSEGGWWGTPLLLEVDAADLTGTLLDECFGPVLVVVRYASIGQLFDLLERTGPALTASVHLEASEEQFAGELLTTLAAKVGRIVWNGYPTGVAVSWAIHHGGPYPATTDALHTSVGAYAIRRWLRPVAYQDVPEHLLPPELVDEPEADDRIPRRVDGRLLLE